jgi:hypothetical protein
MVCHPPNLPLTAFCSGATSRPGLEASTKHSADGSPDVGTLPLNVFWRREGKFAGNVHNDCAIVLCNDDACR